MPRHPAVVVLHDGTAPSHELLDPVAEHAEVRLSAEHQLADRLRGAEVLYLYDFFNPVLERVWDSADRLRWVHVAAAGVDAVLTPAVRSSDVVVTNSRGVFDESIAEYVLAQLLSFAKDLPRSLRLQGERRWLHRESERLAGTRALVVGTGGIGRAIARKLRAVGVQVRGAGRRPRSRDEDFGDVVDPAGLHEVLGLADWVVVAAPLTEDTRGMFDRAAFEAMRSSARFINVARGELADTDALVAALERGTIAGAALDVVDPEPLPREHALWGMDAVRITPHNSGDFVGWRDELTRLFVRNFQRWRRGESLLNVVDKDRGYVPSTNTEQGS